MLRRWALRGTGPTSLAHKVVVAAGSLTPLQASEIAAKEVQGGSGAWLNPSATTSLPIEIVAFQVPWGLGRARC